VEGFRIGCDVSPDGSLVATGSADGSLHLYSWSSGKPIKTLSTTGIRRSPTTDSNATTTTNGGLAATNQACTHVAFHPLHPQVMAACGWDGSLLLLGDH
jgi:WD40 repeat protein